MPEITPSRQGRAGDRGAPRANRRPSSSSATSSVGNGAAAEPGKALAVDYKGVRCDDGESFRLLVEHGGKPFQFLLGANQVIQGWEQGLEGMRVGGRRELIVPPDLAYGDHGQGSIRPNETLVFVVDLLDVR